MTSAPSRRARSSVSTNSAASWKPSTRTMVWPAGGPGRVDDLGRFREAVDAHDGGAGGGDEEDGGKRFPPIRARDLPLRTGAFGVPLHRHEAPVRLGHHLLVHVGALVELLAPA